MIETGICEKIGTCSAEKKYTCVKKKHAALSGCTGIYETEKNVACEKKNDTSKKRSDLLELKRRTGVDMRFNNLFFEENLYLRVIAIYLFLNLQFMLKLVVFFKKIKK